LIYDVVVFDFLSDFISEFTDFMSKVIDFGHLWITVFIVQFDGDLGVMGFGDGLFLGLWFEGSFEGC
jgi:hypothetical protein